MVLFADVYVATGSTGFGCSAMHTAGYASAATSALPEKGCL